MAKRPDLKTVIGKGIAFPVLFASGRKDKLLETQDGIQKINQSLWQICMTQVGERYNNPEFGTPFKSLLFELNDSITKDLLYLGLSSGIKRWERRITVTAFSIRGFADDNSIPEHVLMCVITYVVNESHQIGSFVFPFVRGPMPMNQVVQGKSFFNVTSTFAR